MFVIIDDMLKCLHSEEVLDKRVLYQLYPESLEEFDVFQLLYMPIAADPVYAQAMSIGDGFFNMFRVEAREVQHREVTCGLVA
eukprot:g30295.t1